MIYAFTGKTGSLKTYKMIEAAYLRWLKGEDIYSNTILMFDRFPAGKSLWTRLYVLTRKLVYGRYRGSKKGKITYFEDISEILEARNGTILFDEAQVLFGAREWEKLPSEFMYKLQQSRKHNLDLFCTTQNMSTIDITYRRLVHGWWHCERIFQIGKRKAYLGLFRIREKDVDFLYNQIDDLKTPDIKVRFSFIHLFKPRLYDTFYDIGFRRFKTLWRMIYNKERKRFVRRFFIIPKKMSLSDAQRVVSSANYSSRQPKYRTSKPT